MNKFDDHTRRLLENIKIRLGLFVDKKIELADLLNRLDAVYQVLALGNKDLANEFFQYCLDLESIVAGVASRDSLELDEEENEIVNDTVEKLHNMILTQLANYLKVPDPSVTTTATQLDNAWLLCPNCIDAWETTSKDAMIICPKCDRALHNPRAV